MGCFMKNIMVLCSDKRFKNRISLMIDRNLYQVDFLDISAQDIYHAIFYKQIDVCIIHSSVLGGYYQLFDKLVSSKKWLVIYFSNKMEIGLLTSVIDSPRFLLLNDAKVEGINEIISISKKNIKMIEFYEKQIEGLKEKIEEEALVKKAKIRLMKKDKLSEEDAYRLILKKSMDLRISKANAARQILEEV